jgi:hypothetical protein
MQLPNESKVALMPRPTSAQPAASPAPARTTKRPVWIWLICAFVALGAVLFPLAALQMIEAGALNTMGAVFIVLGLLFVLLNVSAAIALFRWKRLAAPLFAISLVLNGFLAGWDIAQTQAVPGNHVFPIVSAVAGFVISALVYLYCSRLKKSGILH